MTVVLWRPRDAGIFIITYFLWPILYFIWQIRFVIQAKNSCSDGTLTCLGPSGHRCSELLGADPSHRCLLQARLVHSRAAASLLVLLDMGLRFRRRVVNFDPKYFHDRCTTYIVNLVVNDGLEPIDSSISSLSNMVKYFKKSPSRMYKFIEVCNNCSIVHANWKRASSWC